MSQAHTATDVRIACCQAMIQVRQGSVTLSGSTEEKLHVWLASPTWHTCHAKDMARWFDFIDQYQRDHGYSLDAAGLQEKIETLAALDRTPATEDVIRQRISLADCILDFLDRTGR